MKYERCSFEKILYEMLLDIHTLDIKQTRKTKKQDTTQ